MKWPQKEPESNWWHTLHCLSITLHRVHSDKSETLLHFTACIEYICAWHPQSALNRTSGIPFFNSQGKEWFYANELLRSREDFCDWVEYNQPSGVWREYKSSFVHLRVAALGDKADELCRSTSVSWGIALLVPSEDSVGKLCSVNVLRHSKWSWRSETCLNTVNNTHTALGEDIVWNGLLNTSGYMSNIHDVFFCNLRTKHSTEHKKIMV